MLLYSVARANTGIFIFHRSQPSLWIKPLHMAPSIDLRRQCLRLQPQTQQLLFFKSLSLSEKKWPYIIHLFHNSRHDYHSIYAPKNKPSWPHSCVKMFLVIIDVADTRKSIYIIAKSSPLKKKGLCNILRLQDLPLQFVFLLTQLRTFRFAMFLFPSYQR